ncbi:MAG: hypothetical protein KC731_34010 [Myxococcales bacterium]|nr:hypothetical protein [Myxococcales bacterium]
MRPRGQAGFSTVELLAVVAMVGIMAAIAITSYRKWLDYSRTAQTKDLVLHLAGAEEAFYADNDAYLDCSSSYALATLYPMPPNDRKHAFFNQTHADHPCFRHLNVSADTATYASFAVRAAGPSQAIPAPPTTKPLPNPPVDKPWYVVYAASDKDNDGTPESMFTTSFAPSEVNTEQEGE